MKLYDEHEAEMCEALAADLRKSKQEAIINEVEFLRNELRHLLHNLKDYASPERVCESNHKPVPIRLICFNVILLFLAGKTIGKYAG